MLELSLSQVQDEKSQYGLNSDNEKTQASYFVDQDEILPSSKSIRDSDLETAKQKQEQS